MELIEKFRGKLIGVDTSIFIYFIEENPYYVRPLKDFFQKNKEGRKKGQSRMQCGDDKINQKLLRGVQGSKK